VGYERGSIDRATGFIEPPTPLRGDETRSIHYESRAIRYESGPIRYESRAARYES
jgi:hypothetical protein